jgi:hypothetical protein
MANRSRKTATARSALIWGLLFFACGEFGLSLIIERRHAEVRYPEFGYKLNALRERVHERPGQPLLLAIGSSRTEVGLYPDVLMDETRGQFPDLTAFNFGLIQADPVRELLCLRQLLQEGIHPDWLMVEVMPLLLDEKITWVREIKDRNAMQMMGWTDLRVLYRYDAKPQRLLRHWCYWRLAPCFNYRLNIIHNYAPCWGRPFVGGEDWQHRLNPYGWLGFSGSVPLERCQQGLEASCQVYASRLANLQISDLPNRALREMLDVCRQEHIGVLLLLMPEASELRRRHSNEGLARVNDYLASITREYGVPLVDARTWVSDQWFIDGHHMVANGAIAFSHRLSHDILPSFLRSRSPGDHAKAPAIGPFAVR